MLCWNLLWPAVVSQADAARFLSLTGALHDLKSAVLSSLKPDAPSWPEETPSDLPFPVTTQAKVGIYRFLTRSSKHSSASFRSRFTHTQHSALHVDSCPLLSLQLSSFTVLHSSSSRPSSSFAFAASPQGSASNREQYLQGLFPKQRHHRSSSQRSSSALVNQFNQQHHQQQQQQTSLPRSRLSSNAKASSLFTRRYIATLPSIS